MYYVTHSLRFTSGATPVDLLAASMAAELSLPHTCKDIGGTRKKLSLVSEKSLKLFHPFTVVKNYSTMKNVIILAKITQL